MPLPLPPIKNGSLKRQVFDTLRDSIFDGTLAPGDALREAHLARDLNVSQSTIREALVQLEHMGLVVRVPNKSTSVTKLTRDDVLERFAIRSRLEEMAFIEAAKRMTDQDLQELRERVDAISRATAQNSYFEEAQADLDFHRYIWRISGNQTLYDILDQLSVPLFAFVSIKRRSQSDNLADVVQSHEDIVTSLETGDEDDIRKVLTQHLETLRSVPESALR